MNDIITCKQQIGGTKLRILIVPEWATKNFIDSAIYDSPTLTEVSGKKLIPLGTRSAILAAETTRTVLRKTSQVRRSSDCRQL